MLEAALFCGCVLVVTFIYSQFELEESSCAAIHANFEEDALNLQWQRRFSSAANAYTVSLVERARLRLEHWLAFCWRVAGSRVRALIGSGRPSFPEYPPAATPVGTATPVGMATPHRVATTISTLATGGRLYAVLAAAGPHAHGNHNQQQQHVAALPDNSRTRGGGAASFCFDELTRNFQTLTSPSYSPSATTLQLIVGLDFSDSNCWQGGATFHCENLHRIFTSAACNGPSTCSGGGGGGGGGGIANASGSATTPGSAAAAPATECTESSPPPDCQGQRKFNPYQRALCLTHTAIEQWMTHQQSQQSAHSPQFAHSPAINMHAFAFGCARMNESPGAATATDSYSELIELGGSRGSITGDDVTTAMFDDRLIRDFADLMRVYADFAKKRWQHSWGGGGGGSGSTPRHQSNSAGGSAHVTQPHQQVSGGSSFAGLASIVSRAIDLARARPDCVSLLLLYGDGDLGVNPAAVEVSRQCLGRASHLAPLLVIYVGVGDGPFNKIEQIESYPNMWSQFDNFTFVNMSQILAEVSSAVGSSRKTTQSVADENASNTKQYECSVNCPNSCFTSPTSWNFCAQMLHKLADQCSHLNRLNLINCNTSQNEENPDIKLSNTITEQDEERISVASMDVSSPLSLDSAIFESNTDDNSLARRHNQQSKFAFQ